MLSIFQTIFSPPRHIILLIVAAWVGLVLAEKRLERSDPLRNTISNLVFYSSIAFILGGRITYAAVHLSAFIDSPVSLLALNPDLFDPLGGMLSFLFTAFIYCQRERLELWSALDALSPFFASLAVGLGLSHLASGIAFGRPTDVPWAIDQWNKLRHPSQIYESLFAVGILAHTYLSNRVEPAGLRFLVFTSLTVATHLFLQAFRGDSTLILGGLRQAQIIDWIFLTGSFILIELRKNAANKLAPPD